MVRVRVSVRVRVRVRVTVRVRVRVRAMATSAGESSACESTRPKEPLAASSSCRPLSIRPG